MAWERLEGGIIIALLRVDAEGYLVCLDFLGSTRESKSSEFPVTPVTCHPEASYFRNGNQGLTVQKSETYGSKVRDLR